MTSGEHFLLEMLTQMDVHMQLLRSAQQAVIAALELEFRQALGPQFGQLVLVGSGALSAETPGSDLDVVCFTRGEHKPHAAEVLRKVHLAFGSLSTKYPNQTQSLVTELIVDARVPILRVVMGSVALDASINQERPVAHVLWLQRVGAAPLPGVIAPTAAPMVTVVLRALKGWLKQRQIPRAKEGCWPTLAWLFMAVHACSSKDLVHLVELSRTRSMAAILAALAAFFERFGAIGGLDGTLRFAPDGTSSEFVPRSADKPGCWGDFSMPDPTCDGADGLTPSLSPATQLLLIYELRRASSFLSKVPLLTSTEEVDKEFSRGDHRGLVAELYEPLPNEDLNLLPVHVGASVGVILFCADSNGTSSSSNLQVAFLDSTVPRRGWGAPFLHRSDNRSELHVRLLDVEEKTGRCSLRKRASAIFCPCHFVCCVEIQAIPSWTKKQNLTLGKDGLDKLKGMRRYLSELGQHHKKAARTVETGERCAEAMELKPVTRVSAPR
jgi:hypothetical protein